MNSLPLATLIICNFIAIGLLPLIFFRRGGEYNIRWLCTAAPFFLSPAIVILQLAGVLGTYHQANPNVLPVIQSLAIIVSVISLSLITMTVGCHRVPLALWHQVSDTPAVLVTWGPYRIIRHPFYSGFILALLASTIAFPHPGTLGCLLYGIAALSLTARREEIRLSQSIFGSRYRDYSCHTGRFFPKLVP